MPLQPERWYRLEGEECYNALILACKKAIENNQSRRAVALEFASLFEGIKLSSFGSSGYSVGFKEFKELEKPIVRNVCRAIVQTGVSKIASLDNQLPQFMTTGGNWAQRIKNIKLDHMIETELDQQQGMFDSTHEAHVHGVNVAMACTGSYHLYALAPPNVTGVRVELDDTLTTETEYSGRFGKAISEVRTGYYAAADLAEMWPELEAEIYANETTEDADESQRTATADGHDVAPERCVPVCQGFMPSTDSTMGRWVWCLLDGTMLCDEDYEPKELPRTEWHFERSLFGRWGTPMTRTIYHQCIRINQIGNDVDKAEMNSPQCLLFHTAEHDANGQLGAAKGWLKVLVDNMQNIPLTAESAKFNRQSLELLSFHEAGAYQISGVSEANAGAKKNPGSSSGKHEHLIASLFTERFARQERSLTRVRTIWTGRLFVNALRIICERDPSFQRTWKPKDPSQDPEDITAKDLDLEAEKYITSIAAVTEEKNSPKDRAEKAYEQLQMGEIDADNYTALLMHFDSLAVDEGILAQSNWIDQQVGRWLHASEEQIAERDFYQSPSKWFDIESAQSQVSTQWLVARGKGAPRDRLAFFERFLSELDVYLTRKNAQVQPAAQTPQMMGAPAVGMGAPAMPMGGM